MYSFTDYGFDVVRKIRPPGELMRKDKLVKISGGKCAAADVSTASAAIIKASDARGVAVTPALQPDLFLLEYLTNNQ